MSHNTQSPRTHAPTLMDLPHNQPGFVPVTYPKRTVSPSPVEESSWVMAAALRDLMRTTDAA